MVTSFRRVLFDEDFSVDWTFLSAVSYAWSFTYSVFKFVLEIFMFYFFYTYYLEHKAERA